MESAIAWALGIGTVASIALGSAAVSLASLAAGAHFIGHSVNRLAKAVEESRRQP